MAALIVSAPFVLACVRAFFFFGEMSKTVTRTERKVDDFIERADAMLAQHDRDIATIKGERRMELKFGRRSSDMIEEAGNG